MNKRIYVESLGCAKNQVDSELLMGMARREGWDVTRDPNAADVIVVNTCGFIESAKKEAVDTFFQMRNARPDAKIVLAGCLAERYGKELELPEADAIFGNRDLSKFPEVLRNIEKNSGNRLVMPEEWGEADSSCRADFLSTPRSCFLKISEGCDHRCAYCAIPLIRGPLRSRPKDDILAEAERLVEMGMWEINIVAQDLGAYGTDRGGSGFTSLMEDLSGIEGDYRLRMLYIHPDTFPMDLLDVVKGNPKILPYFDIPFQHSHPKVLRGMGRVGDREKYVSLIRKIREEVPGAVVRSTLMLGFPGEDREAFDDLLRFVDEAQLDWMGSFTYSREEDTPAWKMRNQRGHNKAHKQAVLWQKELEERQTAITRKRLEGFVGKTFEALVEEPIQGEDLAIARIYSQAPEVDGLTVVMGDGMEPGDVVKVGIRAVRGLDLEAVLVKTLSKGAKR